MFSAYKIVPFSYERVLKNNQISGRIVRYWVRLGVTRLVPIVVPERFPEHPGDLVTETVQVGLKASLFLKTLIALEYNLCIERNVTTTSAFTANARYRLHNSLYSMLFFHTPHSCLNFRRPEDSVPSHTPALGEQLPPPQNTTDNRNSSCDVCTLQASFAVASPRLLDRYGASVRSSISTA